jgi:hypothetical protein
MPASTGKQGQRRIMRGTKQRPPPGQLEPELAPMRNYLPQAGRARDGPRLVWLDDATLTLLREHRRAQLADRLRAGRRGVAEQRPDLLPR